MNWEFIFSAILAFGLFFVVMLTLGFYISFRRDREIGKSSQPTDPVEGRYFTRHIPDSLKPAYEAKHRIVADEQNEKYQSAVNLRHFYVLPVLLFLALGGYFVYKHNERFILPANSSHMGDKAYILTVDKSGKIVVRDHKVDRQITGDK